MMTVPSIFKINSLPVDKFIELKNNIKINKEDNTKRNLQLNNKPFLFEIMKIIYIDYTELQNNIKNIDENDIIITAINNNNNNNNNAKKIFKLLDNNYDDKYFIHIKNFTFILNKYIDNIDSLLTVDINAVNIINWLYISIINISSGLNHAIDNAEVLEKSYNKQSFKDKLDNIIDDINNDKLITFLKITNHDNDTQEYNKRFKIFLNGGNNMALVKYMNDDYQYYSNGNNELFKTQIGQYNKIINNLKTTFNTKLTEYYNTLKINYKNIYDRTIKIIKTQPCKYPELIIKSININGIDIKIYKIADLLVLNKDKEILKDTNTKRACIINSIASDVNELIKSINIDKIIENFNSEDEKIAINEENKFIEINNIIINSLNDIKSITTNKDNTKNIPILLKNVRNSQKEILESINDMNKYKNLNKYEFATNTLNIINYDTEYLFGKFTKIYEPRLNIQQIAEQMEIIKKKALEGKPVFILGYGASGAGKTSSLIYFKGVNDKKIQPEDGLLINLCNFFAKKKKFINLTVKTKEFFVSDDNNLQKFKKTHEFEGCDIYDKNVICSEEIVFEFDGTVFKTKSFQYKNKHIINNSRNNTTYLNTLSESLIHLIDTDRFVKATTNNPNSSRSHVLVFIEMKSKTKDSKDINLIVGDFAGVENKFYCDDVNTLVKFLNIKRDNSNDVYYNIEQIDNDNINAADCDKEDAMTENYPLYDFEKPLIYDNSKGITLPILKNVLEDFFGKNIDNLEIYKKLMDNDRETENIKNIYENRKKIIEKILNYNDLLKKFVYEEILGVENFEDENFQKYFVKLEEIYNNGMNILEKDSLVFKMGKEIGSKSYNFAAIYRDYNNNNKCSNEDFHNCLMEKNKIIEKIKIYSANKAIEKNDSFYVEDIKKAANEFNNYFEKFVNNDKKIQLKNKILLNVDNIIKENTNKTYTFYRAHKNDRYNEIPIKLELDNKTLKELFEKKYTELHDFKNKNENKNENETYFEILLYTYSYVYNIINETRCRFDYGKQICKSRLEEGKFINESLKQVRETIKEIIIAKNKDNTNISPNFIDECLDTYCPTNESCFELNTETKNNIDIPSKIFKEIYDQLKYQNKTKFYEDILVSVFCVLNISKDANNPPPVPYIDINRFKQIYYQEDIKPNKKVSLESIRLLINEFYKIVKNINYFESKLGDILYSNIDTREHNVIYQKARELMETLSESINNIGSDGLNIDEADYKKIVEFINLIDNSNAVSAIGTLEFVDQIAKFNTVNTICSSNSPYLSSNEDNLFLSNNMKELYSE